MNYQKIYDQICEKAKLELNESFTWLTTSVKEILEQKENFINFTTKNSHYKLYTYEQH